MEHKLSPALPAWNLALVEIQGCLEAPCYYLPLSSFVCLEWLCSISFGRHSVLFICFHIQICLERTQRKLFADCLKSTCEPPGSVFLCVCFPALGEPGLGSAAVLLGHGLSCRKHTGGAGTKRELR